ncbi:SRPBCC domain-containing protein [Actinoplanes bogorensis]|uniref:SRPBCC domain-containing protein n=1 Tax=Paractinoplanes bogorensis TaxID=1610840 RepID=A0ABS5YY68_9ACTN|nr:SRPBCC domain-containing protein [Actinoplanes bogorensis]MBU2668381.1 SRPBCC domain-containing protein [Actinoplanes bogorensis]
MTILGTLRSTGDSGVVRIEDRYDTDAGDLWSAVTDPDRLARWWGKVDGDLRPGGGITLFVESAQLTSTGRVEICEPPRHLRVSSRETDESWAGSAPGAPPPFDSVIDVTLTPDGDHTILVIEVTGLPLSKIAGYGAGWQMHAENLATYVTGHDNHSGAEKRWAELLPPYEEIASRIFRRG